MMHLRLSPPVLLTALMGALVVAPARASTIEFDVTIDYFPASIPDDPSFPSTSQLVSTPTFLARPSVIAGSAFTAIVVGPPGEEIFVDKYGRVKVKFFWDRPGQQDPGSDPCAGVDCDFALSLNGLAAQFPAFGFDNTGDVPPVPPPTGPIIPLGTLASDGVPIDHTGRMVAYDGAVQVGTWDVTASAVPLPASLALYGFAVSVLGALRLRRQA